MGLNSLSFVNKLTTIESLNVLRETEMEEAGKKTKRRREFGTLNKLKHL